MDNTDNTHNNNEQQEREYRADKSPEDIKVLENKWNAIQVDYQKQYPSLTAEDLNYRSGEFEIMTGRIANRTKRSREEIISEITYWDSKVK